MSSETRTCETCGGIYEPVRRKALASDRFCSFHCQRLARDRKPAGQYVRRVLPQVPDLPYPPDLSRGRCATAPPGLRHLWTSRYAAERHAAKLICLACPVLDACREWAVKLPVKDYGIYGGMEWADRVRAKRGGREQAEDLLGIIIAEE